MFFRKTIFFKRRTKFLNTLRNLTISVPFYIKVSIFSNFEEAQDFFEKPIVFKQKPHFEPFKNTDFSSRIIQQICYLHMFNSFQVLFWKTIVFVRKHKFWTFEKNFLCQSHSTTKLLSLAILKKQKISSRNFMYFFWKELGFERFDESEYFKCILRQICYPKRFLTVSRFFFRKTHLFSFKKDRFWTFWKFLSFSCILQQLCDFLQF